MPATPIKYYTIVFGNHEYDIDHIVGGTDHISVMDIVMESVV